MQDLNITSNDLLSTLPEGLLADLSNLQWLNLSGNDLLSTLPEGIFGDLSSLRALHLDDNNLSMLPEGIFSGLSRLKLLWLHRNPGTPFTLTIELERTDNMDNNAQGPATIVVKVAEGAPFDMTVSLSAQGGTLSANTATIVAGEIKSETVMVPSDEGNSVTVRLGPAPALPQFLNHAGIQTAVGDSLILFGQAASR